MSDILSNEIEKSMRGGFFLVMGSIISNLILSIYLLSIPRLLGPDDYGLFRLCNILPSIMLILTDYGVDIGITRFVSDYIVKGEAEKVNRLFKIVLVYKTILSIIILSFSLMLADYFAISVLNRPYLGYYIKLISLYIPFQAIFTMLYYSFISIDRMEYLSIVTISKSIIKVTSSIILIMLNFGLLGVIIGHVLSEFLGSVIGLALMFFKVFREKGTNLPIFKTFREEITSLIKYGFPLFISTIFVRLNVQYRSIFLSLFTSNIIIGNLQAAINILVLVSMVSQPISATLLPAFSRLKEGGKEIIEFFNLSLKYTTMIVLPLISFILIFSKEIVQLIYGFQYEFASNFLVLWSANHFLVGIGSLILGSFLNGTGNTIIIFYVNLIKLLLVLCSLPLLMPLLGVEGLILAVIFANFIGDLYGFIITKKKYGIKYDYILMLKIYLISFISIFPVLILRSFLSMHYFIIMIICGFSYFIILITLTPLIGVIKTSELQNIQNVLRRYRLIRYFVSPFIQYMKKLSRYSI
ncbi:Na+-driven multidrug efflux pump [Thaumarchaeota archaeon SCGC AB-539-E09]|nr:Na+-driven multidrug efflux pump [Thaumarchaeota archaeon SCGC AB-539-E09]